MKQEALNESLMKEFRIRIHSKVESYQGQARVKHSVTRISNVNYSEESRELLGLIEKI